MKRTFWITVLLVAAATAATALLLREPSSTAGFDLSSASWEAADDVRVRREFVRIAAPAAAQLLERQATTYRGQARPATSGADEPLLSKARRKVVGDGRHRPEPFPRIK